MRTWNWLLLILAAFLLGGIAGYQLNNDLVARRARLFASSTPAERAAHMADTLARRVGLTPEQRESAASILLAYDARFDQMRQAHAVDRDAIRADLHRDIQAILTPEQIPLHEAMLEEMRAAPPPPRRFPPR
jgi:hypothetical protein